MSDIDFHCCTSSKEEFIDTLINGQYKLSDGDLTNPELLTRVLRQVTDIIPELNHGRAYAMRTLIGEDIWFQMDRRHRIVAEQFLSYLMAKECLSLSIADGEEDVDQMYCLSDPKMEATIEPKTEAQVKESKEKFKNECISKYGMELGAEFYESAILGKEMASNIIKSRDVLYFDLCKVRPGFKFPHLVIEVITLVKHPKGNLIPDGLCHSLWIQFDLRIPELETGTSYTVSEICGDDYWNRLSDVLRSLSDDCLTFLIEEASIQLPLIQVPLSSDGIPRYRLK